ncbi:hypothetical protein S7711_11121 [Stachybotrys chartarum IBT 7711]|uniref:Uncharacterized protein n=1 Tax=Stachybotrys chartarum (strain CBS 109288 / IBT 7711) TaxID=1280523 RepID=A0A084BCD8_STACB|nr:hypothetical protein S7711_11121 [Stachybotrys chartarum IBT 7711]KFA73179.1 hypothetical protein S40288_11528 [Stachybotrys chartarum IBT 40288]
MNKPSRAIGRAGVPSSDSSRDRDSDLFDLNRVGNCTEYILLEVPLHHDSTNRNPTKLTELHVIMEQKSLKVNIVEYKTTYREDVMPLAETFLSGIQSGAPDLDTLSGGVSEAFGGDNMVRLRVLTPEAKGKMFSFAILAGLAEIADFLRPILAVSARIHTAVRQIPVDAHLRDSDYRYNKDDSCVANDITSIFDGLDEEVEIREALDDLLSLLRSLDLWRSRRLGTK